MKFYFIIILSVVVAQVDLGHTPTLLFASNVLTTGRFPSMQLVCIGTQCSIDNRPARAVCENIALGQPDPIWKCSATLPKHVVFGTTDVVCEGFSHQDDPLVLAGSCAMEYTLKYVHPPVHPSVRQTGNDMIVVFGICLLFLLSFCCIANADSHHTHQPVYVPQATPVYHDEQPASRRRRSSPEPIYVSRPVCVPQATPVYVPPVVVPPRVIVTHGHTPTNHESTHTSTSYGSTKRRG